MTAYGDDDLAWASGIAGEALDALGGVDQFRADLDGMGGDVREAVLAAGGAGLVAEAVASIAEALKYDDRVQVGEALKAAGGADLVAEALAAAGGAESVAEALMPIGGADAVLEAVTIASRLDPT